MNIIGFLNLSVGKNSILFVKERRESGRNFEKCQNSLYATNNRPPFPVILTNALRKKASKHVF